ncbi:MAG: hypothetical protein MUE46_10120 [Xanthomonadales bacterium]|nr:hypothetical protein [Xanthomonadales bacterium]
MRPVDPRKLDRLLLLARWQAARRILLTLAQLLFAAALSAAILGLLGREDAWMHQLILPLGYAAVALALVGGTIQLGLCWRNKDAHPPD